MTLGPSDAVMLRLHGNQEPKRMVDAVVLTLAQAVIIRPGGDESVLEGKNRSQIHKISTSRRSRMWIWSQRTHQIDILVFMSTSQTISILILPNVQL
ncbi:Hypothetical protein PHPALM_5910 [Phytophthora palmivora]|uniref:Uncharacterized protein n=1 Tax=Phytophthora palmivora TaxID=4796 RepID=A0A2P4YG69_9STRA|nr:Hypothetical protein PHPALM_5910 [Phytophthora palmivora]